MQRAPRNSILLVKMRMARAKPTGKAPRRPSIKALEGSYHADLRTYVAAIKDSYQQFVAPVIPGLLVAAHNDSALSVEASRAITAGRCIPIPFEDIHLDGYLDTLQGAIAKAASWVNDRFPDSVLKAFAQKQAAKVDRFAGDVLQQQVKAIAQIDVTTSTPSVARRVEDFTTDNVRMIRNLADDHYDRIQAVVSRNIQQGYRASSPSDRSKGFDSEIEDIDGITENRAALIARDQTNKFNGEVARARQVDLGINQYIWHNSDDERVRGNPGGLYPKVRYSHWDREGQVYSWDDPPPDGHPGHPVNCRCWAEPILPEF